MTYDHMARRQVTIVYCFSTREDPYARTQRYIHIRTPPNMDKVSYMNAFVLYMSHT